LGLTPRTRLKGSLLLANIGATRDRNIRKEKKLDISPPFWKLMVF
jgi:hypothetical protein